MLHTNVLVCSGFRFCTRRGLLTHKYRVLCGDRFTCRYWHADCLMPSHYLNSCCIFSHKTDPGPVSLHWRQNDHDGVSNHQPHGCLLNCLFRCRSKKTSKLRVTGLCVGNSPGPVNSQHKGPVTRKMFPFDDVIMLLTWINLNTNKNN